MSSKEINQKGWIVACNWKQNGHLSLLDEYKKLPTTQCNLIVFPPFPYLNEPKDNYTFSFGAQNVSEHTNGAFTGEVGADMLKQIYVSYCLVGHSERRVIYNETPEIINRKLIMLQKRDIIPLYCFGEDIEHFNTKQSVQYVYQQIDQAASILINSNHLVLAYEPIWSIGTGIVPKMEQIDFMIEKIKQKLAEKKINHAKILYGGSVNDENIEMLIDVQNLDGVLIGGTSLKVDKMAAILSSVNRKRR